jgi:hypothetical protein
MPKKKKQGFSIGSAAISPSMPSAQLIAQSGSLDKSKSPAISEEISERLTQIRAGDTTYLEEMLLSQAIALNAFGADLLMKAGGFIQEGMIAKFPELTRITCTTGTEGTRPEPQDNSGTARTQKSQKAQPVH